MKRPSQKTWDLIRGLYADPSFWQKLVGHQDHQLRAFEEIASLGEALVIPHLTPFLLDETSEVRDAAARTIGRLLAHVLSLEFVQLDEAFRDNWGYISPAASPWIHLKPKDLDRFRQLPNPVIVMGVTSCHGSGYIRDAAINELVKTFDGSELPFLLVRLNDWVEVVRESATAAVTRRIRPEYACHFSRYLRLVFRLRSCGRSQNEQIVADVIRLLQEPAAASILREGTLSDDRWLRRESFRIAIAAKSPQSKTLLKEMLSDADPIMRLWAARNVLDDLCDAEVQPFLSTLVHDRFMPVRCEALSVLVRRSPTSSSDALKCALLDGHSSVRSLARHWIKVHEPEFDFASVYRHSLKESLGSRQCAAILGLGETGTPADAAVVLPFLGAPLVGTRKAAIRALAALDRDRYLPEFLTSLTDKHPGVSNEATSALASKTGVVMQELQSLFRGDLSPHVRKNLFKLLTCQPFWARGVFLFEALRDRDEHIVELGQRTLRDWLARSRRMATAPNSSELQQLRVALKASAGMLSRHEAREFEFYLKTYG